MKPLLSLQQVSVRLGSHWALREVDLQLHAGERVALVGANGWWKKWSTGKSANTRPASR